jgi:hypothetical protein
MHRHSSATSRMTSFSPNMPITLRQSYGARLDPIAARATSNASTRLARDSGVNSLIGHLVTSGKPTRSPSSGLRLYGDRRSEPTPASRPPGPLSEEAFTSDPPGPARPADRR